MELEMTTLENWGNTYHRKDDTNMA